MRAVLVEEVLARAGSGWMGSSSSEMFARLCMLLRDIRQFSVYIILFRRRMTFGVGPRHLRLRRSASCLPDRSTSVLLTP